MTEAVGVDGISLRMVARVVSVEGLVTNAMSDPIAEGDVIKVGDLINTNNNGTAVVNFAGRGDLVVTPDRVILFDELFWGNLDYLIRLKYIPQNWSKTLGTDTDYDPEFDISALPKTGAGGNPASRSSESSIASGTRFEANVQQTIPFANGTSGVLPENFQTVRPTVLNINREQENSPPRNILPAKVNGAEDERLSINGLSVFDAGGDLQSIQLSVVRGVITLDFGVDVTVISGANGSKDIVFAGSQNQLNSILSTLVYMPDSDFNGTDSLTIISRDSTGEVFQDVDTLTINIHASSDFPLIRNAGSTLAYTEGDAASVIDSSLSVSDVDSANMVSATIKIRAGFVVGEDVLSFTDVNGIAGSYDSATGILTLSGTATKAQYETALESIRYHNTNGNNPNAANRTVSWVVNDGSANSSAVSSIITVAAVNDIPVMSNAAGTLAYTEGDTATVIDSSLSITDVDSDTINSAKITIGAGFVVGEDVLSFTDVNGITGSYDSATGILTLSGTATKAQYQAALESITYTNTNSDNPNTANRTVSWVVNDGSANSSAVSSTITVAAVNDIPVISNAAGTLAYSEGDVASIIDSSLSITDVDSDTIDSATITISAGFVVGEDVLSFTDVNGIAGSYDSATGILTLSGTATKAQYETALESIRYHNTNGNNPNTANRTVSWVVNDGLQNSTAISSTIVVTEVNDAPVIGGVATNLNYLRGSGAKVIDDSLALADVDDVNLQSAKIKISAGLVSSEDVLVFVNTSEITGSYDSNTGVLTLSGDATMAQYKVALESVTYTNSNTVNPNAGNRTLSWSVKDDSLDSNVASSTITMLLNNVTPTLSLGQGKLKFDGNDHLSVPSIDSSDGLYKGGSYTGMSIVASVKYDAFTSWTKIINLSPGGAANHNILLGNAGTTGTLVFEIYVGAGKQNIKIENFFQLGVETHVAITQENNGDVTIYKDGVAIDPAEYTVRVKDVVVNSGPFNLWTPAEVDLVGSTIGHSPWGNPTFKGTLDDVGVFNKILSLSEIKATVQGDFSALDSDSAILFHYGFEGANPLNDQSNKGRNSTANDTPTRVAAGATYLAGSDGRVLDDQITLTDGDHINLSGAKVIIIAGLRSSEDVLSFTSTTNISGSFNSVSGELVLSGVATVAEYQTVLRSVTYNNTSGTPAMVDKTITWTVTDSVETSAIVTSSVRMATPLILDLDGDGIETTSMANGVMFDIDADGIKDKTGWVASDDALLVRDINGDGQINGAAELFGDSTKLAAGHIAQDGFVALADLDSNADGVVDEHDVAFKELQLWQDHNQDGRVQVGELSYLSDSNVARLNLSSQAGSEYDNGNLIGLESEWIDSQGNSNALADVWFRYQGGEQPRAQSSGSLDYEVVAGAIVTAENSSPALTGAIYSEGNAAVVLGTSMGVNNGCPGRLSAETLKISMGVITDKLIAELDTRGVNSGLLGANTKAVISVDLEESQTFALQMSDVFSDDLDSLFNSILEPAPNANESTVEAERGITYDSNTPYLQQLNSQPFFDEF